MFKWNDATTDPVTGARSTRLSTDYNANLNMAWNPDNAGQNLFEITEWMEEQWGHLRVGPVFMPASGRLSSERVIREYGKSWRIWAREMVRLGCPINTVEDYLHNVLGGHIIIEGLIPAHFTFRVRTARRNGTVWSVSLQPIDTNGCRIPWTHSILLQ